MALVKLNNRGVRSATTFGSISALGEMTFIKKLTASSSATLSFVDGTSDVVLDNTYKEYMFIFKDIHAETDATNFQFQGNAAAGSGYFNTTSAIDEIQFKMASDEIQGGTVSLYGIK